MDHWCPCYGRLVDRELMSLDMSKSCLICIFFLTTKYFQNMTQILIHLTELFCIFSLPLTITPGGLDVQRLEHQPFRQLLFPVSWLNPHGFWLKFRILNAKVAKPIPNASIYFYIPILAQSIWSMSTLLLWDWQSLMRIYANFAGSLHFVSKLCISMYVYIIIIMVIVNSFFF